jgi:hypothetical protein
MMPDDHFTDVLAGKMGRDTAPGGFNFWEFWHGRYFTACARLIWPFKVADHGLITASF